MAKFKIKKAKNKEFYFILVARNGQTIVTSETYKRKSACLKIMGKLWLTLWKTDQTDYIDETK